jgi:Na+/melibiose symporter-like transporter
VAPAAGPAAATLAWLGLTLLACTLAYSGVAILHQAWGTRWGGAPAGAAQVAWREGATLLGVVLASALPAWLGLDGTSAVLAVALGAGLLGLLAGAPPRRGRAVDRHGRARSADAPSRTTAASPWRDAAFRRLLAVFMLNGVASAIPATLLPFFVADRLQAAGLQPCCC